MKESKNLLEIQKLVYNGYGFGYDKTAVFVPNTLPGDKIQYKKTKKKRFSTFGEITDIVEASKYRDKAPCKHFNECGGCQLQQVSYENQLLLKKEMLLDCFTQQAYKHLKEYCKEIIASPKVFFYRNKMDFSFASKEGEIYLGLKKSGFYDQVVELETCLLQSEFSIPICKEAALFFNQKKCSVWNYETHEGLLRHLTLRHSKNKNEFMIILTCSSECINTANEFANHMSEKFNFITSFWLAVQKSVGDTQEGSSYYHIQGHKQLLDSIGNTRFQISPNAFFQTNTEGAKILFETAMDLAQPKKTDTLLDLYCGTGSIGLIFAPYVKKVIGIELNAYSIEDAKKNAQLQGHSNCIFFAGDVKDILKEQEIKSDLLICDPPRSGLHPKALKQIVKIRAPKIAYISCHPMNMIRDLAILEEYYTIECIQPVDMFPHTYHIECISILKLKK